MVVCLFLSPFAVPRRPILAATNLHATLGRPTLVVLRASQNSYSTAAAAEEEEGESEGEAEAGAAPVTARYEKGDYRFAREKNCDLRLLDFETFGGSLGTASAKFFGRRRTS